MKTWSSISTCPATSAQLQIIFPEPIFLMSILTKSFAKIRPKGIDPDKYEKEATKIICGSARSMGIEVKD